MVHPEVHVRDICIGMERAVHRNAPGPRGPEALCWCAVRSAQHVHHNGALAPRHCAQSARAAVTPAATAARLRCHGRHIANDISFADAARRPEACATNPSVDLGAAQSVSLRASKSRHGRSAGVQVNPHGSVEEHRNCDGALGWTSRCTPACDQACCPLIDLCIHFRRARVRRAYPESKDQSAHHPPHSPHRRSDAETRAECYRRTLAHVCLSTTVAHIVSENCALRWNVYTERDHDA
mmetsp:Transcript_35171/g.70142  ORF Transcript_35171/g.70142 Transcript_35171/m.70142 type:complete len:238 (-) Transcript_35171:24-737(-)